MSMFGKIGVWYDTQISGGEYSGGGVLDITPTVESLVAAHAILYGEAGRSAKIGAVRSPLAKMTIQSVDVTLQS